MRLLTFSPKSGGGDRIGVLRDNNRVLDLSQQARKVSLPFDPADMLSLIASGELGLTRIREVSLGAGLQDLSLDDIKVSAPIPRPRKNVFCVGWNYLEHFNEGQKILQSGQELPKYPVFFTKAATAVTGPFDVIPYDPSVTEKLDWEVELGVIIGKAGKNISQDDAMRYVFGYTVVNDISARNLQKRHGGQWFKGKSLDGSCPIGPYIVTADEIDPNHLRVITRINGIVKQDSNTQYFYFKIPQLIAELSLGMTLEPGDILSTGTPQGVGFARTPPEYLKPGDVMETEIIGLGTMRNVIGSSRI
jgi:2-keto-4-pentenoate hydratase/2-oxohepta-3-ene-1,7-dioic acid hydratase in catechol pathway